MNSVSSLNYLIYNKLESIEEWMQTLLQKGFQFL